MRLIGVLDHQILESELRLDRAKQRRLWLVKTEPNDPALTAGKGANIFDRDIAYPLAVAIKRAGDYPGLRSIGCDGCSKVEHFSQKSSAGGRARGVRAARCRGPRGSD